MSGNGPTESELMKEIEETNSQLIKSREEVKTALNTVIRLLGESDQYYRLQEDERSILAEITSLKKNATAQDMDPQAKEKIQTQLNKLNFKATLAECEKRVKAIPNAKTYGNVPNFDLARKKATSLLQTIGTESHTKEVWAFNQLKKLSIEVRFSTSMLLANQAYMGAIQLIQKANKANNPEEKDKLLQEAKVLSSSLQSALLRQQSIHKSLVNQANAIKQGPQKPVTRRGALKWQASNVSETRQRTSTGRERTTTIGRDRVSTLKREPKQVSPPEIKAITPVSPLKPSSMKAITPMRPITPTKVGSLTPMQPISPRKPSTPTTEFPKVQALAPMKSIKVEPETVYTFALKKIAEFEETISKNVNLPIKQKEIALKNLGYLKSLVEGRDKRGDLLSNLEKYKALTFLNLQTQLGKIRNIKAKDEKSTSEDTALVTIYKEEHQFVKSLVQECSLKMESKPKEEVVSQNPEKPLKPGN